jgi:hypothetical protein
MTDLGHSLPSPARRYFELNEGYGSPFVFHLSYRGFYSEVNNLLNAVIYGLGNRRRLIVDESEWCGGRWTDFYTVSLPDAPASVVSTVPEEWVINSVFHPHFNTIRQWSLNCGEVSFPELGIEGSIFEVKRLVARMLTQPVFRDKYRLQSPFAAFHIRRGDKTEGYERQGQRIVEGDHVPGSTYVEFLDRTAPKIQFIYVLTDDYCCVEEVRAAAPNRVVNSLCPRAERGFRIQDFYRLRVGERRAHLTRLVTETAIGARSDLFVGSYKSNTSRFVPLWHDRPERCFSVDSQQQWSPD